MLRYVPSFMVYVRHILSVQSARLNANLTARYKRNDIFLKRFTSPENIELALAVSILFV